MLKDFDIKPVLMTVKKSQANSPLEWVHKVILNMLVTKDLDNNSFDHIYPWSETLTSIAWEIRASYHRTIMAALRQAVFVRDMIFNLASVVDWRVLTSAKE